LELVMQDPLELLAEYAAAGTPCVLATVVGCEPPTSARPGDRAVVTADGRLRGWVGGSCSEPAVRREALRALAEGTPRLLKLGGADGEPTMCPSGGALEVFVEPRLPRPMLLVFGASPAARTLVALGALTGFRTCAVHPGARRGDFAADLVLNSLDLAAARPGADTWAIVATMGHYDEDALEAVLAYPDVDVALVASRRRAAAVRGVLNDRGLDAATLDRIHAPAGHMRAATQEEIALAALAEVAAERRRRAPERAAASVTAAVAAAASSLATDPVCGMAVDVAEARFSTTYKRSTFYFCGAGCRDRFQAKPSEFFGAVAS
jgi:xanthine dehydrogenase accessory factor